MTYRKSIMTRSFLIFEPVSMKRLKKFLHALLWVKIAVLALCATAVFLTFAVVITWHEVQFLWSLLP
jgi:hypothetical protein